ncbi:LysR family transcriptional regulator [Corynebacterium sp. S7]
MEFRQLEAFLVVAEELHFGRAAERLHVAQSPLSRSIRALESELGVQLFDRTTRQVTLSIAGEAMVPHARIVLAEVQKCKEVARSAAGGETGVVSIGFGGASGYRALSHLVRTVGTAFPGIRLEPRPQVYSEHARELIETGEIDFGVVALPVGRSIQAISVRDENIVVALPASHPLASSPSIELPDLDGEPLVSYPAGHGSSVRAQGMSLLAEASASPSRIYEATDPYSLLAMVGAGVGVALVVESTMMMSMRDVVYRPITNLETAPMRIGLAWAKRNPNPSVAKVIESLNTLREDAGSKPSDR